MRLLCQSLTCDSDWQVVDEYKKTHTENVKPCDIGYLFKSKSSWHLAPFDDNVKLNVKENQLLADTEVMDNMQNTESLPRVTVAVVWTY